MAKRQSEPRPDTAGRKTAASVGLPVLGPTQKVAARPPRSRRPAKPPVVSFVSLGCAKNLVDSEKMLGDLAESGAVISGDESVADTVVVNTCGFLESSRIEALDIIHELGRRKAAGLLKRIVVAGCLVQRDGESLRDAAPEIDALVGVNNRDDVVRAVWRMDRDAATDRYLGDYHGQAWHDRGRLRLTPRHYGYVRISEGCNQKCTFCTIPSIRGPMHSKTPDELVAEAQELTEDGAKEIILIGQDTTSYGLDLEAVASASDSAPNSLFAIRNSQFPIPQLKGGLIPSNSELSLSGLLRRLDREVDGARWIRLMYVYPSILTDAIIDAIAECDRVVKYIDIPLQHINDRVLKRMARRVTRKQTETLLDKLRRRIPGVTIRTTFIVGFPGETETEFRELLDFATDFGFDAAGAFQYSLEPDTPAGRLPDQLDARVKQERYERFMKVQQRVAFAAAKKHIGREFDVLIDAVAAQPTPPPAPRGTERLAARHAGQAPEVDGVCIIESADGQRASRASKSARGTADKLIFGEFVRVRCSGTADYDLVCRPV